MSLPRSCVYKRTNQCCKSTRYCWINNLLTKSVFIYSITTPLISFWHFVFKKLWFIFLTVVSFKIFTISLQCIEYCSKDFGYEITLIISHDASWIWTGCWNYGDKPMCTALSSLFRNLNSSFNFFPVSVRSRNDCITMRFVFLLSFFSCFLSMVHYDVSSFQKKVFTNGFLQSEAQEGFMCSPVPVWLLCVI